MNIPAILNGEITEYNFETYGSMDNVESLDYFLRYFDLWEDITLHDGTYAEIDGVIGCHSGGRGDMFSHKIRFEVL